MNDATTVSVVLRSLEDLEALERLCGQRRIQRHPGLWEERAWTTIAAEEAATRAAKDAVRHPIRAIAG